MIELPLWLAIAAKVLFAASVVVGATTVAEKSGPLIAGLIIAMPLSIGPTYVLLALAASPRFVAASAVGSIGANIAVALFATVYILLARRLPMPAALALALAAWFGVSWLIQRWDPSPLVTLAFSTLALVAASVLTRIDETVAGHELLCGSKMATTTAIHKVAIKIQYRAQLQRVPAAPLVSQLCIF